jgi:hypothetical protein
LRDTILQNFISTFPLAAKSQLISLIENFELGVSSIEGEESYLFVPDLLPSVCSKERQEDGYGRLLGSGLWGLRSLGFGASSFGRFEPFGLFEIFTLVLWASGSRFRALFKSARGTVISEQQN